MPRHQKQANFDAYTKTNNFSNPALKRIQFWSLHWNQVKFDIQHKPSQFRPKHENQVMFDPHTKTKLIPIPAKKTSHCDPHNEFKSSSMPRNEIKSISNTHTKTKSSSMLRLKPRDLQPAYKNQVNFDHPHEV